VSVAVLRFGDGLGVVLGPMLAKAGEGTIYEVVGHLEWVAKVFHPTLTDLAAKVDKVTAMIASPPPGAIQHDGFVVLTWPMHLLESDRGAVGYVMPRVDTTNAVEIHSVSNPSNRADPLPSAPQWITGATWMHLVHVAANLCLAVEAVHRVDAVIGDFQERNILVSDTTRVTLVDCDSMQFTDASGRQYLCAVGRPEFTAPELAGANLRTAARDKPSDLFALAVHIHLLLMAGNHPFLRGTWTGPGDQPDALTLAQAGHWAGGWHSPLHTHPLAPPVSFLPEEIQQLFLRAFTTGAHDPTIRPTATEWRTALRRIHVTPCPRHGTHQMPASCTTCPWCAIDDERANRKHQRQLTAAPLDNQVIYPVYPRGRSTAANGASVNAAVTSFGSQNIDPDYGFGRSTTPATATKTKSTRTRLIVAGGILAALAILAAGALIVRVANPSSRSTNSATSPHTATDTFTQTTPSNAPPPVTTTAPAGQVTYSVTGTKAPGDIITVTYVDASGRKRTQRNVYIPWSLTVTPISPSGVGSVQASSQSLVSQLNCSITTGDGQVLSSNTANAAQISC
jgi:hypothetical protein